MKIIKISAIWCPGCLAMKKVWKNILNDYNDLNIQELDYDVNHEEITKYDIGKVLPVIIFTDEQDNELERLVGEQKEQKLRTIIDKYR